MPRAVLKPTCAVLCLEQFSNQHVQYYALSSSRTNMCSITPRAVLEPICAVLCFEPILVPTCALLCFEPILEQTGEVLGLEQYSNQHVKYYALSSTQTNMFAIPCSKNSS